MVIKFPVLNFGIACMLTLSACETPEQTAERRAQFIGHPLAYVIESIGQPKNQTSNSAIWSYKRQSISREPIQHYVNGKWVITGYRNQNFTYACRFVATLSEGAVVDVDYSGNLCTPYAPPL
jgi:hypothetical protein